MHSKSPISKFDFKPRRSGRRPRRLRLHWIVIGLCGITGAGLLLSAHHRAEADRDDSALIAMASPGADAGRRVVSLELPSAEDIGASVPSAVPSLAPTPVSTLPVDSHSPKGAEEDNAEAPEKAEAPAPRQEKPAPGARRTDAAKAETEDAPPPHPAPEVEWTTMTVKRGDNLAALFKRAGLTPRDVYDVVHAGEDARKLTRIFPGDEVDLDIASDGELRGVRYELSESDTLFVERADGGFRSRISTHPLERRIASASATIDSSLFAASTRAGMSGKLTMELAAIFGWDVDFALDIRKGDSFTLVYEEFFRDGEKVRDGNIIAAEFVNQGERFRAVRYTDPKGHADYYAPDGRSMRKAFLRTPVNFTRVSSNFNPERYHPILGKKRPHMGTDYAAPPGTPIKAAGDGKIIFRGRKGGYGNAIILQHGTRYTTLYGHMRAFKRGQRVGDHVKQGQIIGFVGSSGLATGPHLHYEFRIDGVHRNPRTVKLPEAKPIPKAYRADFEEAVEPRLAQLEVLTRTNVAQAESR